MKSAQQIDQGNIVLWQNRYSNPAKNYVDAGDLEKNAEELGYEKGASYAKLNKAMACFLQSKNREVHELVTQTVEYFYENTSEVGYIWLLNIKANLFESLGDYEKGLSLGLKAFKHAKERNELETEADSASILGLIYTRLCNFEKAHEYYNSALKIREDLNDFPGVASTYNRLGMICRLTGEFEESVNYYRKSLEIRKSNSLHTAVPWTLLGIASTYEEMEKLDDALNFYNKGLINSDKRCALQCKMGSGRIYKKLGDLEKAEQIFLESLKLAEELSAKALIAEIYLSLSKLYENKNQFDKALDKFKLYIEAKEFVLGEEAKNRLQNVEVSHAIEKSEQEKEIFRLRNVELKTAYQTIEEKNHQITSSIKYASYIQTAILPHPDEIKWLEKNMFILFLPKDIVSGDFYWFTEKHGKTIVVAADCTGHGVPGALMSMLGVSLLEEIINKRNFLNANEILNELRQEVIRSLKQSVTESKSKDGMDMSLIVVDNQDSVLQFAGANNSLIQVSKGELTEYKADKMPVGIHQKINNPFTRNDIAASHGDMFYLFSDGYQDQFGGPSGKKFMIKKMKEIFTEIASLPISTQKEILLNRHLEWKGSNEQVDDILVIGVKIV